MKLNLGKLFFSLKFRPHGTGALQSHEENKIFDMMRVSSLPSLSTTISNASRCINSGFYLFLQLFVLIDAYKTQHEHYIKKIQFMYGMWCDTYFRKRKESKREIHSKYTPHFQRFKVLATANHYLQVDYLFIF